MTAPSARGVALVVDDESALRTVLKLTLAALGYRVLEAEDVAAAMAAAATERLSLAVIDYYLSDATGLELARALRQDSADLAILFLSGAYPAELAAWIQTHPRAGFLAKPFLRNELLAALAKVAAL